MNGLVQSRKFWLTIAALVVVGTLAALGKIPADQVGYQVVALVGLLTLAIAHEDHGKGSPP